MPDEELPPTATTEIDGYAAGAAACAAASFVVPVVLAVAALFLARAYEVRRDSVEPLTDDQESDAAEPSRSDTLVWLARIGAWTNLALVAGGIVFLLIGIAARVIA